MSTVVVDPGHGGTTTIGGSSPNNATGPTGLLEKNLTLDVSMRVAAKAVDLKVVLTRSTDTNLGLADRAGVAKSTKADAFVSVHFNGWPSQDVQGTETYLHEKGSKASLALAKAVQANVLGATGLSDRGVKRAAFAVLNPDYHDAATAACLVEISFLTQASEETRLKDPTYLDALAESILAGMNQFLGLSRAEIESTASDRVESIPLSPGTEDAASANLRP